MDDVEDVDVTFTIDNVYDGETIKTVVETTVTAPPEDECSNAYSDWEYDEVFQHTGTGRHGDAGYFVEVTASSRPDLIPVGKTIEFC